MNERLHTAVVILCVSSGAVLSFAWYLLSLHQRLLNGCSAMRAVGLTSGTPLWNRCAANLRRALIGVCEGYINSAEATQSKRQNSGEDRVCERRREKESQNNTEGWFGRLRDR